MPASYPSTNLHKANNFSTLFTTIDPIYNKQYDNFKTSLFYTYRYRYSNTYRPQKKMGIVVGIKK